VLPTAALLVMPHCSSPCPCECVSNTQFALFCTAPLLQPQVQSPVLPTAALLVLHAATFLYWVATVMVDVVVGEQAAHAYVWGWGGGGGDGEGGGWRSRCVGCSWHACQTVKCTVRF
jgi:hypothetical protein